MIRSQYFVIYDKITIKYKSTLHYITLQYISLHEIFFNIASVKTARTTQRKLKQKRGI